MTAQMYAATFFGAAMTDLVALAAAMRSGRVKRTRWRKPITYAGILLQGAIACIVQLLLLPDSHDLLSSVSIGMNLPLLAEKLAALTPNINPSLLPREPGFSAASTSPTIGQKLETLRQFVAKER